MSPPLSKRRKLEHSNDGEFSGDSDASMDSLVPSGVEQDESEEELGEDDQEAGLSDIGSEDEQDEETADSTSHGDSKPTISAPAANKGQSHRKSDTALKDGVYTAEVYKSHVFKIQVDELLEQVKPKYGKKEAENAMRTLKEIIEQLPSRGPMPIPEAEQAVKAQGVVLPFPSPRPLKDAKYKLQFERPSNINATGSYPLKIANRTDDGLTIDLVVTMPKSIFQEKDYLNHRYFYKRAFYLACIAAGIKSSKQHKFKLSFETLHGNDLLPVLVVRPSGDGGPDDFTKSRCSIRILLALPAEVFPSSKLLPTANCVRPKDNSDGSEAAKLSPTPFYNATLQADASVTAYLKLFHVASSKCDEFQDACVLGRTWLRQRGFGSRIRKGGFGNFEWTAVMALLLEPNYGVGSRTLSSGYSSYQLFKATLQFLAGHNLSKSGLRFQDPNAKLPKGDTTPVFFDGPRGLNILYKMSNWSWARLQLEAKATVEMLADSVSNHFESTFIQKTDLIQYQYDAVVQIPLSALGLDVFVPEHDKLARTCTKIYDALSRALTDRVTSIAFSTPDEGAWALSASKPSTPADRSILISLVTDPVNAGRTVDHGPSAEDKKAAASFRQFWGEKAELRRFKDGSILESVVWSSKESSRSVLEQIIRYVLGKHLTAQAAEAADFAGDSFAGLISSGRLQGQSGTSAFSARMNAFTTLEKDIRGLEGLPLQIRTINAAHSSLRYSSVDPECKLRPACLVVQFEGSARWPDDLCAIQRTKIAFLLKLSDLLAAEKDYVSRVGLENPSQPSQNQAYLDVFMPSGYSFQLRIHHDREATLLDRQLKDKSLDGPSRETAAVALATYKHDFIHVPAHTRMLQTLCTRYPALSPSIRLTKRWFAAHLLLPHFSPEFIELLVVRTFLQHPPWPVPSCATTGFLRTLLYISRWDWRHVPLVVDYTSNDSTNAAASTEGVSNTSLKPEDVEKIQTRFEAWRRIDPGMNRVVLFAATNLDTEGTTWTDRGKPEKVLAARMTALAKAAVRVIRVQEEQLLASVNEGGETNQNRARFIPGSLFVSHVQEYDIVIRLASKYSIKGKKKIEPAFKNLQLQQGGFGSKDAQKVDFEPVALFVDDLRNIYGDAALWSWDPEMPEVIVALWNPAVMEQRSWKIKAGWNSIPSKGKASKAANGAAGSETNVHISLNEAAVYNEIKRLGGDLVASIEVKGA